MPPAAATPNCTDTPRSTVRELGCATMVSGTGGPASPVPEMEQFVVPEVASLATFNVPPKGPPAGGAKVNEASMEFVGGIAPLKLLENPSGKLIELM